MIIIPTTGARNNRQEWKSILVSGHLGEGLLQLLGDRLVLLLLGDQLILQPVHLLLQFLHGLLSKLSAGLCLLQLRAQGLDLLLVGLLPLVANNLKSLEVAEEKANQRE